MHAFNIRTRSFRIRLYHWIFSSSIYTLILSLVCSAGFAIEAVSSNMVYKLSPFDLVLVSVYGQEDLHSEQRISDQGHLLIPLLGEVPVGGRTVSEAAKSIEDSFVEEGYLRYPVVTISIKDFAPKVVTVLGEVENPGSVEIPPGRNGIPVQIAIAGAGGFTGTAKISEVRVSSGNVEGSDAAQSKVVDISKLLDSKRELKKDDLFIVYPDDIIFVPRRIF